MDNKPATPVIKGYLSPSGAFHTPHQYSDLAAAVAKSLIPTDGTWFDRFEPLVLLSEDQADCEEQARLATELVRVRAHLTGRPVPWAEAVEITATITKMPEAERLRMLALDDAPLGDDVEVIYMLRNTATNTPWRDADKAAFDSAAAFVEYERRELVDARHAAKLQDDLTSANADKQAYAQNAVDLRKQLDELRRWEKTVRENSPLLIQLEQVQARNAKLEDLLRKASKLSRDVSKYGLKSGGEQYPNALCLIDLYQDIDLELAKQEASGEKPDKAEASKYYSVVMQNEGRTVLAILENGVVETADAQGIYAHVARLQSEVERLRNSLSREETDHSNTIEQRDRAEEAADCLASAISAHFRVDVGEHSSANCPWSEASKVMAGEYETDSDAERERDQLKQRLALIDPAVKPLVDYAANAGMPQEIGVATSVGRYEITHADWFALAALYRSEPLDLLTAQDWQDKDDQDRHEAEDSQS